MKKGLCSSVKRKDHELTIKHIEIEKIALPISYYKECIKYYPIYTITILLEYVPLIILLERDMLEDVLVH